VKKIVVISVVLLVALVALVVAPNFVDWNKYKPQILSQLHEATGHEYKIDGPLELAVLPYPHVSIDGLSVATPSAAGSIPLVQLDKASAQLALMPLFSGEVVVSKVVLQKPVFQIAIAANGAQSWMTPELQAKTGQKKEGGAAAGLGNAVALNEISIKNGSFAFTDNRSGQKITLTEIDVLLQGDSLYGPFDLNGGFVYDGVKTKIKLNTGRLENLAESIAVQLELGFPDLASSATYAGVAAFKEKLELQGETGIEAPDLGALMAALTKKPAPAYLVKKPLSSKGILTLDKEGLAYRNLKAGFAGIEGTGNVVAKNFEKDAKGPLDVNVVFETSKPYDLQKLLPPPAEKKAGGKTFLPETITLPRDITGSLNVKSAAVQFGATSFKDVAFSVDRKEKSFGGQLSLKGPGNASADINGTLDFASQSKSGQDGAVIFADPVAVLDVKTVSAEPLLVAQGFSKTPLPRNISNLLAHALVSEGKLSVKPKSIGIESAFVKLAETRVNASGAYLLGGGAAGRNLLKIDVSSFGLDADAWMKDIAGPSPAPAVEAQKPDIKAIAAGIALPFDAEFSASVQSLRLKDRDYSNLAAKGKLTGPQLSLETFQLTSNAGDVFTLAGGIKDVKALSGLDLTLQADVVDLEQTLVSLGVDTERLPEGVGKSEFLAEVKGHPEKLAFTTNLKAMRASMQASGSISDALTAPKVSDLTLRLQHPNYVDVARIFSPKFNSGVGIKKNLDVFASMSRKENVYTFSQLQATVGPAVIKGDVVADVSGPKPAITAALEFTDLPIDELTGAKGGKPAAGSVGAQPLNGKQQDVRWSRNAIDTSMLHLANIELKATAGSITWGNWNFKNAGINIGLKDGAMDIRQMDASLYGGHVAVTGALKSPGQERQPISFAGNILAQNVNLEEFVRSFSGSQLVKAAGSVSVETALQTTGLSPAALIFDLKGKGTAKGKDIVFQGFDLARLSAALAQPSSSMTQNFTGLLDATLSGGTTSFETLDGVFTIAEGVINFDKMLLSGKTASVSTAGTVSLPLWTMDLTSTVQLAEPPDAPPLKASFKGPIDRPAQTFGQNAMQQFFQRQLEGVVLNPLLDKLDGSGTLKNLLGGEAPRKAAPAPQQQPVPPQQGQTQPQQAAPEPQPQQAPAQQQAPRPSTPEEAFFGILQDVIEGQ